MMMGALARTVALDSSHCGSSSLPPPLRVLRGVLKGLKGGVKGMQGRTVGGLYEEHDSPLSRRHMLNDGDVFELRIFISPSNVTPPPIVVKCLQSIPIPPCIAQHTR